MSNLHQFVKVDFKRFKAFRTFSLRLRHFNILVGPNNAGKSTILAAFRILAAGLRKAESRKAEIINGPNGSVHGHVIDLTSISVAEENIFYNYDNSEPATVVFELSNRNTLTLWFPEAGTCFLIPDAHGKSISTPKNFRSQFNCPIGFVPILGPVEHHEPLFEKEAARLALFNYRAARNFRNIWHHYPDKFQMFRDAIAQTWPGMDIQLPELDISHMKPRLHMYCPEDRIPREIFWSGFGFQVWCQMLTHVIQSSDASLFLIDEPDIYLHSELQRQLLGLLRNLGPDILIATHSTEIITEAEADDIVVINKKLRSARRIKDPSQLSDVFNLLGSNINPILTQLAKTRRVLFVEGKDFQILGKFAHRLQAFAVSNRAEFAVVPVGGFSPERMRDLKAGMEATLGAKIVAAAILDRDYRSNAECDHIEGICKKFCEFVSIHPSKEIENLVLIPSAMDRAAQERLADRLRRSGTSALSEPYVPFANAFLHEFANAKRSYVTAQYLAQRRNFSRTNTPKINDASIAEVALNEVNALWDSSRFALIPGKEALSAFNESLQKQYAVSITPAAIINTLLKTEIPSEVISLIGILQELSAFRPSD